MTASMRQRIAVAALGVALSLAGCGQPPQPTPTLPPTVPMATPQPSPTVTLPPPTFTPTAQPSPTPVQGLASSLDDLAVALNLTFTQTNQVGQLLRFEASAPADGLQVNAIVRGTELLSIESTLTGSDEAVLRVFDAIAALALPRWAERTAWLQASLAAAEPGGLSIASKVTTDAYATLLRYDDADNTVALLLSLLCCDNAATKGEIQPFDPTLGLGLTRQALQWAYEGLPIERRFTFSRASDRMGQPMVIGTARDKRATLTLVGPEEQLVFINLSLAVPTGVADAETQAIALTQRLLSVALPNWPDGASWADTAVRAALAGQTHEQRRQGLRVLARPDPANERLVDITIAAIQRDLPLLSEPMLTQTPPLTTVTITGLPADALSCLTVVFYQGEAEVERRPVSADSTVSGPEADEVLLEGDLGGTCPWEDYWTASAQLPVVEGQVRFDFAPLPE